MRPLIAALSVLALAMPACAQSPEPFGPELLPNAGLETVEGQPPMPAGWYGFFVSDWGECAGNAESSAEEPFEGERCIKIGGVQSQYAFAARDRLSLDPGKSYLLSVWVRTELARGQQASLVASWFSEERWVSLQRSAALGGRKPWTQITLLLEPSRRPSTASSLQVSCRITGTSARGAAWCDAFSLRECKAGPPPAFAATERRRVADMCHTLLVEREVWRERLSVLERRTADLQTLVRTDGEFRALQAQFGGPAVRGEFLTQSERPRSALAAGVPSARDDIVRSAEQIGQLPQLRADCFAQMQQALDLKRQLDARPDARRFFLWAQLASKRVPVASVRESAPPASPAGFLEAVASPPDSPGGDLLEAEVRTHLEDGAGQLTFTARVATSVTGRTVHAGLFAAGGVLIAVASAEPVADEVRVQLSVPEPSLWFPDFPYCYDLRVGLFEEGRAVDWLQQKVAFREVRIVEQDVTATMRHAHDWAMTDFTFLINGQPYFLRGTVCGQAAGRLDEAEPLLDELWLDYLRTYGSYLSRISAERADELAQRGISLAGSLSPPYAEITQYASAQGGMEDFREVARSTRWLADHPAVLTVESGNEAELSVWGADLPSVYGKNLWHVFSEAQKVLRDEMEPTGPIGYVRAKQFRSVAPVPGESYSGVNQYTGRYWGRSCTISPDLGALSLASTLAAKPLAITEWNGPKYSWATRGVSGVDEQGAAQYIFDYYRNMTRAQGVVMSTEFVLNWVVTPIEDLTTLPLQEALARRAEWKWNMQQGVPWYPDIWPDLLADTPARRTMAGFQSPIFDLCEAPGPITVIHADRASAAADLVSAFKALGKVASASSDASEIAIEGCAGSAIVLGGVADRQPGAIKLLEDMGVIGTTSDGFPGKGEFLIQRRVNPFYPDAFLVAVTASDEAGMEAAVAKLKYSAAGLSEAYARHASCRRAIALVDDSAGAANAFARYVLELPTRGLMLCRDSVRTNLEAAEFVEEGGALKAPWQELGAVIVAAHRELTPEEDGLLAGLTRAGVNVIWSSGTLSTNPEIAGRLGVSPAGQTDLTQSLPMSEWAQRPLIVPDMGGVSAAAVERFGSLKPGSEGWREALGVTEFSLGDDWRVAALSPGRAPVVAMRPDGDGAHWLFGCDLDRAAQLLTRITQSGVIHNIYDRDTACGIERVFRLVANAAAWSRTLRGPETSRLRATVSTDRESYAPGETMRVTVRVADPQGRPVAAGVRVSCAGGSRHQGLPGEGAFWVAAAETGLGTYEAQFAVPDGATAPDPRVDVWRQEYQSWPVISVFADAVGLDGVSDWDTHTVSVGGSQAEAQALGEILRRLREDISIATLNVDDRETWIELQAELDLPNEIRAGKALELRLRITRVEDDRGNDWLEETQLVLKRVADGREISFPVAAGKLISSVNSPPVNDRPDDCIVVTSDQPAAFSVDWPSPEPGEWQPFLKYLYTDNYHIADTDRLQRMDPFAQAIFTVVQ